MVVSVKVAHNQGVATKVPAEKRGKDRGESTGAGGGGRYVEVDYCDVNLVYCDDDALMLSGIVIGEKVIGVERLVGGVLPNEEG